MLLLVLLVAVLVGLAACRRWPIRRLAGRPIRIAAVVAICDGAEVEIAARSKRKSRCKV